MFSKNIIHNSPWSNVLKNFTLLMLSLDSVEHMNNNEQYVRKLTIIFIERVQKISLSQLF